MNRDESKHRGPEIFPNNHQSWFGPIDSVSGGTWFSVHPEGRVACLLNGYDFEVRKKLPEVKKSRGTIAPEAIMRRTPEEIREWFSQKNMNPYPAFRLIISDAEKSTEYRWNGVRLESKSLKGDGVICSSSSWKQKKVIDFRKGCFEEWKDASEKLEPENLADSIAMDFHHLQKDPMVGPLITREVSVTRSVTQAMFSGEQSMIRYWKDPQPGHPSEAETLDLSRISSGEKT